MVVRAVFLTEISPAAQRGFLNSVGTATVPFGIIIGSILAHPVVLGNDHLWEFIYLIHIPLSIATLVNLLIIIKLNLLFNIVKKVLFVCG